MSGMNALSRSKSLALLGALAFLMSVLVVGLGSLQPARAAASELDDINPDTSTNTNANASTGGRVNGLASVAGDNQMFYSASEWGGLYKTTNGGASWDYLEDHLPQAMWDVEVDPGNTGTVYATSFFDGRSDSISGIQVSHDGGATWTHPGSATPGAAADCTDTRKDEPSAFGIAINQSAPANVFVGTNCGVARSTNSGATWTFLDPPVGVAQWRNVWDVVAQPGAGGNTILDICGDDGYYRSTDSGANWTAATTQPPAGHCVMVASPDENYVLFATTVNDPAPGDGNPDVWESDDGGATWTNLGSPQPRGGRLPMLAINQRAGTQFDLWFGDISLYRGTCNTPATPAPGGTPRCPSPPTGWAGGFTQNFGGVPAHDDAGDLVFDTEPPAGTDACPEIFASDGGVHTNTDNTADCHNPNWVRSNVGHHALWLFGMSGADSNGPNAEFLHGGTQDNGSFGTSNAGNTPPPDPNPVVWSNPDCCDVFDIVTDPNRVLYTTCCAPINPGVPRAVLRIGTFGLANSGTPVPNIPTNGLLEQFRPIDSFAPIDTADDNDWVLVTRNCGATEPGCEGPPTNTNNGDGGVYVTEDITANPIVWTELGAATEPDACGIFTAVSQGTPTFYAMAGNGSNRCDTVGGDAIWKYTGTNPNGTWDRIDDNDGLVGGAGIFAVDPTDPNRLYMSNSDPAGPHMVFSNDGGTTWEIDADLDTMMTGNGDYLYANAAGPTDFTGFGGYIQPTLVAFDPQDKNNIVAGGHDSGVFLSTNGGQSWALMTDPQTPHLSGTDHITQPRFGYFDHETNSPTKIFIGSQGRGFWRLTPSSADLEISKTNHPDPAIAGDTLFYDITVTNNGPDEAPDVTVTDQLPDEVDYVTDTAPGGCTENPPGSGDLSCSLGNMNAGETITFTIDVAVHSDVIPNESGEPDAVTITNKAQVVSGGATDPDTSNNSTVLHTIVKESADLGVQKLCETTTAPAGTAVDCTIFITNNGPSDARNVVVTDTITSSGPFVVSNISSTRGECDASATFVPPNSQEFECRLGRMEPITPEEGSGRARITYDITAQTGQEINNRARVTSDTDDPNSGNNETTETFTVESSSNLALTKQDSPDPVVAGESLTYSLVATNNGPSAAEDVVIKDFVPAGVTIDSVSKTAGGTGEGCNAGVPGDSTRPTTCTFSTIAPGETGTMFIVVTVDPPTRGELHNDAIVTSSTLDPAPGNNEVSISTQVAARSNLILTKDDSPDPVVAGTPLDYKIRIENAGPSTSKDTFLEDVLSDDVEFVSAAIQNGAGECEYIPGEAAPNRVECELNDLDPGEHVVVFINTDVKSSALNPIQNTATATSDATDPSPGNATETETTAVNTVADLAILKTSDKDIYKPSETIAYTISVTNLGPSDAQTVKVVDTLPPPKTGDYVFDTGACTYNKPANTLTCQFGTVAAGQTKSINMYFRTKGRKNRITNTATVSSPTFDPPPLTNNTSVREVNVQGGV